MAALEKPEMPILRETPEQIYQRMVNRLSALAEKRGDTVPATAEGEIFYDLLFPLAQEISEQQQLLEYEFLQAFPIWADGEFLQAHGYAEGIDPKDGESEEDYRARILEKKRTEEGNGRPGDYEIWAREISGVGSALAVEHERNDVSIDLYLTDLNGQPVTTEMAQIVRSQLENKRIAGHDLQCHPAEVFQVNVQVKLRMTDETKREAAIALITQRQKEYLKGRSSIVYQQLGSLFWMDSVADYTNFTLNGGSNNLTKPIKAVSTLNLVVLP